MEIIYYSVTSIYLLSVLIYGKKVLYKSNWINIPMLSIIILGFIYNVTMSSMEYYYSSDDYLNERKVEVLHNYENGNINSGSFKPVDDYFEDATISENDNGIKIIFWADRNKSGLLHEFKWKSRSDFSFYLDESDEEILKYYNNYKSKIDNKIKEINEYNESFDEMLNNITDSHFNKIDSLKNEIKYLDSLILEGEESYNKSKKDIESSKKSLSLQ